MYALHNALKGWTLYDLSEREVQIVINSLSKNEINLTKVCEASSLKWVELSSTRWPHLFSETALKSKVFQEYVDTSSVTAEKTDTEYYVVRAPQKNFHERAHQRVSIVLKTRIIGATADFETTTQDVSEGGIQLADVIPQWVSGYFIVEIEHLENKFSIMCSLVEDQATKKRVQIMSEENDPNFVRYKTWLKSLQAAST